MSGLTTEQQIFEKDTEQLKNLFGSIAENIQLVSTEEDERLEVERIQQERENAKQNAYEKCGVGEKFFPCRLSKVVLESDDDRNKFRVISDFIDEVNKGKPRTLWLLGANGNGKTMYGALICRETFGTFRRVYDIEDELKDAMSFNSKETRKKVFDRYKNYDVLVIDEVGRFPTDSEKQNLFHILNDRYENNKSTVLISNFESVPLKNYLGKAITDRFIENCVSVVFNGASYRIRNRK